MTDTVPRPRPRFELTVPYSPGVAISRVKALLAEDDEISGMVLAERLELTVTQSDQHIWSPRLVIDLEETDQGTLFHAKFGPHDHVWTMYMALFAILLMGALVSCTFGLSQWIIGTSPWAFWLTLPCSLLAGLVFGAAFVGQGLSGEQMYRLRDFLRRALEEDSPAETEAEPISAGPRER